MKQTDKNPNTPVELQDNIKFGVGLFYTILSLLPSSLMKALSAIGFVANRDLGEKYLTDVFNNGNYHFFPFFH